MARLNRGDTTKLSIRLSANANKQIMRSSKNLNLSKAGIILYALSQILEDPPSVSEMINLDNQIDLEPGNFPITIKRDFSKTIDDLQDVYNMKKNTLIGLMVSNYFENLSGVLVEDHDNVKPVKVKVEINDQLKKKIVEYSDKHYIPMSGLISLMILNGPYKGIPPYSTKQKESFFTRIPTYIYEKIKSEAKLIPEQFYIELCVYEAFSSKEKIFDIKRIN